MIILHWIWTFIIAKASRLLFLTKTGKLHYYWMSKCNIPKKLFLVRTCYKKNTHTCKFVGLRFYCNKKSFKSCHVHIWCFLNSTYMMALPNHFLVGIVSRFSALSVWVSIWSLHWKNNNFISPMWTIWWLSSSITWDWIFWT